MKTFKYIIYSLFLFAFSSCFTDVPLELELSTKKEEAPFTIEIIRNSRQVILTQEKPWEAQSMVYFNVIKNDSIWKMWYNSVGEDIYNDMFGAICYATSYDGKIWYKNIIKNNDEFSNILFPKNNFKIIDQFVFYDEYSKYYIMIGASNYYGEVKIHILKSHDGVDWLDENILYDKYYDTQFSILNKDDKFHIYLRKWHNGYRSIGKSIVDRDFNIIESPNITLTSNDRDYPHIYNNAASKVDENIILFPTLYNQETNTIKMTVGFEKDNKMFLTDLDITNDLYYDENIKWGIVSPGLIPTNEPNTYWLYYYGNTSPHYFGRTDKNNISKYYRIKVRILNIKGDN